MGIKTHYGPIDSVRWRKSFYTQYSYKRNLFQNATGYCIQETWGSVGIGLAFFAQLRTSSFLLWFQAFPHRVIPENPGKRGSLPSKNHGGLLSMAECVRDQKGLSNLMCELRRHRRKEKPALQEHSGGKWRTLAGKGVRIRNPISACRVQGQGLSIALQVGGREQICLYPAGPGRERVSCVEQLEQHTSPEGGLKCPFSWLTEEADGCTGGAWEHQMVLRACLQPPLANTILAAVWSSPHSSCIPWNSHWPRFPPPSLCVRERSGKGEGTIIRVFQQNCSSQLLNFHSCNFLELWRQLANPAPTIQLLTFKKRSWEQCYQRYMK